MVFRPLALVVAAGLTSVWALAQTGSAGLHETNTPAEATPRVPGTPLSPETKGDIFMARKMYREAIEAFREGSPKDPVLQNKIGIAYHQMQQLDNAKKNYERALRLKPDYVEAQNNIGTIHYARKSYRSAINCYKKALRIAPEDPRSASIYSNLGTAYFARKQYREATEAYQIALRLDPNVFETHSNYGVLLQERNVEERAKFHYYLAKMYAKANRNELALQYLRKALEEGFKEKKKLQEDPEFAGIRDTPEFQELLTLTPHVL